MSQERIKQAIKDETLRCPECKKPIRQYDKYIQMTTDVWDGPGDARIATGGSKVTLICGNDGCSWKERTEYWDNYIEE